MKPASPELMALLATRQFYVTDLYTFSGGNMGTTVLRYCSGDMDVVVNGKTYSSGKTVGPYFNRSDNRAKCHWKVGLDVDTLTFDVLPGASTIAGTRFQTAIKYGFFDGAEMLLERCFMPTYGDTRCGTVRYFFGRVASVDTGRSICTFSINTHTELLNQQLPRNLYQANCKNNLGDKACGIDTTLYRTTGTVEAGPTVSNIPATIIGSFGTGTFDLGKIVFTSGDLIGLGATIKQLVAGSPNQISLIGYLPKAPAATDTFYLYYGCDKTQTGANGCAKFNNLKRYRAEPVVPQPTVAT